MKIDSTINHNNQFGLINGLIKYRSRLKISNDLQNSTSSGFTVFFLQKKMIVQQCQKYEINEDVYMNDTQNDAGKIDNKLKKIHETTDFFEIFIGKFVLLEFVAAITEIWFRMYTHAFIESSNSVMYSTWIEFINYSACFVLSI